MLSKAWIGLFVFAIAMSSILSYASQQNLRAEMDEQLRQQNIRLQSLESALGRLEASIPKGTGGLRGEATNEPSESSSRAVEGALSPGAEMDEALLGALADRVTEKITENEAMASALFQDRDQLKSLYASLQEEERESRIQRRREQRGKQVRERVEAVSERLRLTAQQEEEVVALFTDMAVEVSEAWELVRQGELSPLDARQTMQDAFAETDEQLTEVLAEDQYEEMQVIRKENEADQPWLRLMQPQPSRPQE